DLGEQGKWLEDEGSFSLWQWSEEDLGQLWWRDPGQCHPGPIASWERRTQLSSKATVSVRTIPCPQGEAVFEALKDLRRLVASRESDRLEELDKFIDRVRHLLFVLLRRTTPLRSLTSGGEMVDQSLQDLRKLQHSSYLTEDERTAAEKTMNGLEGFVTALEHNNPKGEALHELLAAGTAQTVIVPGENEQEELRTSAAAGGHRVLTTAEAAQLEGDLAGQVVITGWARQERMAELLRPPIATDIVLLLYHVERQWFEGYRSALTRRCDQRRKRTSRRSVF